MIELQLISIFITELLKYAIWFGKVKGMQLKQINRAKGAYTVAGCIIIVLLFFIVFGVIDSESLLVIWCISAIMLFGIVLEGRSGEKGLQILQAYLLVNCIDEISDNFLKLIWGAAWYDNNSSNATYLLNNIIVLALLLTIVIARKKMKRTGGYRKSKPFQWLIYIGIGAMITAVFLTISGFAFMAELNRNKIPIAFSSIITIFSYGCIIGLIMMLTYIYNENRRNKMLLQKESQLVEMQKNMYEAMLSKNEETRRFRHDIQNHLMYLGELAEQEMPDKIKSYINSMTGNIRTIQERTYTVGNSVMDAVLNYYIPMLRENVEISIEGYCVPEVSMSEMEFCTVVSNLFQNAVEALNRSEDAKPYLKVKFIRREDALRIIIKNSMNEEQIILNKNHMPITTKKNKEEHGIGLCNAKEVVEQNGGLFFAEIKEKEFVVIVEFPL